jgi:hypothetical protein
MRLSVMSIRSAMLTSAPIAAQSWRFLRDVIALARKANDENNTTKNPKLDNPKSTLKTPTADGGFAAADR